MMSLWIGASSGNLFGNIDLRVVQAGVIECWSVGPPASLREASRALVLDFCFAVLATDRKKSGFDRAAMRSCAA